MMFGSERGVDCGIVVLSLSTSLYPIDFSDKKSSGIPTRANLEFSMQFPLHSPRSLSPRVDIGRAPSRTAWAAEDDRNGSEDDATRSSDECGDVATQRISCSDGDAYQIFLSYRAPEAGELGDGLVFDLQARLHRLGYSTFLAGLVPQELQGGRRWERQVQGAIDASEVFVAVCSATYGLSKGTKREFERASALCASASTSSPEPRSPTVSTSADVGARVAKCIIPVWHSGEYPPRACATVLGSTTYLPEGNGPMKRPDGSFVVSVKSLVDELDALLRRQHGVYPRVRARTRLPLNLDPPAEVLPSPAEPPVPPVAFCGYFHWDPVVKAAGSSEGGEAKGHGGMLRAVFRKLTGRGLRRPEDVEDGEALLVTSGCNKREDKEHLIKRLILQMAQLLRHSAEQEAVEVASLLASFEAILETELQAVRAGGLGPEGHDCCVELCRELWEDQMQLMQELRRHARDGRVWTEIANVLGVLLEAETSGRRRWEWERARLEDKYTHSLAEMRRELHESFQLAQNAALEHPGAPTPGAGEEAEEAIKLKEDICQLRLQLQWSQEQEAAALQEQGQSESERAALQQRLEDMAHEHVASHEQMQKVHAHEIERLEQECAELRQQLESQLKINALQAEEIFEMRSSPLQSPSPSPVSSMGSIEALQCLLQRHPSADETRGHLEAALRNASATPAGPERDQILQALCSGGMAAVVAKVVEFYPADADLSRLGCRIFNMVVGEEEGIAQRDQSAEALALPLEQAQSAMGMLMTALRAHPEDSTVQREACAAVCTLSRHPTVQLDAVAQGAVPLMVLASFRHPMDSQIQTACWRAFCLLVRDTDDAKEEAIEGGGAIEAIVNALQKEELAVSAIAAAAGALHEVLKGAREQACRLVNSVGAFDALIEAMQRHPGDARIQEECCWALCSLQITRVVERRAVARSIAPVLEASRTHALVPTMQAAACKVLQMLEKQYSHEMSRVGATARLNEMMLSLTSDT
ncbi:hypothetical protein CYMTET_38654 [Cymbomonas tetramitiformis]|uniref:TIR domain-containing protein n=1 Tax=Cymbomonas tetramitiformis TaxID=36881 RepID=A0AAE0F4Q8_9CHLO|nr:hypothetical protein CYMTET_38654 [Cymbomonas tetramitiformis]